MQPISKWFSVRFDEQAITLQVGPPGSASRREVIPWQRILRVCFKAEDIGVSDGIYIFTDERPQSYAIPIEADGGQALWNEILRRNLFAAELAIQAAMAIDRLFCWPPLGGQPGPCI